MSGFDTDLYLKLLPESLVKPFYFFPEIGSTNDWMVENCGSLSSGTICVADFQTKGRGTWGRTWNAAPGENLTFSILLSQPEVSNPHLVTLAAMYCWTEVFSAHIGESMIGMKWPNDVLIDRKKAGGVLTEVIHRLGRTHFIVGMGLNVNQNVFSPELKSSAASLSSFSGKGFKREELLSRWVITMQAILSELAGSPDRVIHRFANRFVHIGRLVMFGDNRRGIFSGLSSKGLPLVLENGMLVEISDPSIRFTHV